MNLRWARGCIKCTQNWGGDNSICLVVKGTIAFRLLMGCGRIAAAAHSLKEGGILPMNRNHVTDAEVKLILDLRKVFSQKDKGYHDAKVSKERDGSCLLRDWENLQRR